MDAKENFRIGNLEYSKCNYEKALEYYKKVIDKAPSFAASYYNSANCYIKLKKFEKAIFFLKNAIEIDQISKYYFNLSFAYANLNNVKKSYIYANVAWALDNNDRDCYKAIKLLEPILLHKGNTFD